MTYLYEKEEYVTDLDAEQEAELRREARKLQSVRDFLQSDQEEDPGQPPVFIKPKRSIVISKWWAIAASLAMLILAGKLFGLRVTADQNHLAVHFGNEPKLQASSDDYQQVMASLAALRHDVNTKLNAPLPATTTENVAPAQEVDYDRLLAMFKSALDRENNQFAERLTSQLQEDQQEYTREVMTTLVDFWDRQRKEDLQMVNDGLQNLAQSIQLNSDEFAQFVNQPIENY